MLYFNSNLVATLTSRSRSMFRSIFGIQKSDLVLICFLPCSVHLYLLYPIRAIHILERGHSGIVTPQ